MSLLLVLGYLVKLDRLHFTSYGKLTVGALPQAHPGDWPYIQHAKSCALTNTINAGLTYFDWGDSPLHPVLNTSTVIEMRP